MTAPDAKQRAKIKDNEVQELINYLADFEGYMPNPDVIMQKTGKGISIFKEMMYDPHIAGMVDARKSGLGKLEIKTIQNDATDEELQYIKDYFDYIDTHTLIYNSLDSLYYGYTVFEIIWGDYKGKQVPIDFRYWDFDKFGFDVNNNLIFIGDGNQTVMEKDKFIIVKNEPSVLNPYGKPLFSRVYWNWFFKKNIIGFWSRYIERYGMPFIYAVIDNVLNQKPDEVQSNTLTQLRNLIQSSIAVIPKTMELKSIDNNSNNGQVFKEFLLWVDGQISIALLGHNAAASATPGSLGNNTQAEDTVTRLIDSDKKLVECFYDSIVELIYRYNFNLTDRRLPDIKLYEQSQNGIERANRDTLIYNLGFEFTPDYIIKTYDDITENDIIKREVQTSVFNKTQPKTYNTINSNLQNINAKQTTKEVNDTMIEFTEYLNELDFDNAYLQPIVDNIIYELSNANDYEEADDILNNIYPKLKKDSEEYRDIIERVMNISAIVGINAENEKV